MSRYRTRSWRAFDPGAARPPAYTAGAQAEGLRILGLDPGSRRTGYGVIERRGADWVHVAHGCVTVAAAQESLPERLRVIFESLREIVATHVPGEVAIERVFVNRNVDSALKLGQARGAALCAVPQGLPVFEYAPRAIKLALVGSGAAEKVQVAHMIRTLLGLQGRIAPDAADALAVAVCHAHTRRLHELAVQSERSAMREPSLPSSR
jgi:crossover junction endodeoxyribonuclease RuvC